jgi:hypothetical protein
VNGQSIGAAALAVAVGSVAAGLGLVFGARAFQAWAVRQPIARLWNPWFARLQTRAYRIELRLLGSLMLAMGSLILWTAARAR